MNRKDHRDRDVPGYDRPYRSRMPLLMVIGAGLLALFHFLAFQFQDALADSVFHFDFAVVNIITTIGAALLLVALVFWMWFVSGISRLVPLAMVAVVIGLLVCFRPVFTGGMGISRWEPRFWDWRQLAEPAGNRDIRLSRPTPLDFPGFLGPQRNGIVDNFSVPLDSLANLERLWKQEVGQGWSGIVARNGFAITMEQRGSDECVVCYEVESGSIAWSYSHPRRHDHPLGGVGPRSTPVLDGERVYAMGANGLLVCLNIESGDLIWKQDLPGLLDIGLVVSKSGKGEEIQTETSSVIWGRSGSPLVVNDLVIVPAGGDADGPQVSLIAFHKQDGREAWRGGTDGISYSSPSWLELAGQKQVVSVNAASVSGHLVETGETLWTWPWPGHSDSDANTSQAVRVGDNRLLVSKGYGTGAELIELSRTDGKFAVRPVWNKPRVLKTKLTSAIVYQGHAYALSDTILECVDLETGQRVWKRGRFGHGQILLVGDKLLVHSERGRLHLVEASAQAYREPGNSVETVSGICWNTFCVYDRYILVRSDLEMACFKVRDGS